MREDTITGKIVYKAIDPGCPLYWKLGYGLDAGRHFLSIVLESLALDKLI